MVTLAAGEPSGTRITGADESLDFNAFAALSKDDPSPRMESKSTSDDAAMRIELMRALEELMTKASTTEGPTISAAVASEWNFIFKCVIMKEADK